MTPEEEQDYIERHTAIGASQRLNRELRTVGAAIRKSPPGAWIEHMLMRIMDALTRLINRINHRITG